MFDRQIYYLKSVYLKAQYSGILRVLFDALSKIGIRITPFYLVLEGLFNGNLPALQEDFAEYQIGLLDAKDKDIREIAAIPGRDLSEQALLLRLEEGNKCFIAKHHGKIAAFTWCDLDKINIKGYRLPLKDNQAYLFDAYTFISFRGKGIAPHLRYQFYKELKKLGKTELYSMSSFFDSSSIRFKKKLNAKFLELNLLVGLFKKYYYTIELKKYNTHI